MKGREVPMSPHKKITNLSDFIKGYAYIVIIGLVAFGAFALYFREYDHPIYGHLDLGAHHAWIGVLCIVAGIVAAFYIRRIRKP